MILNQVKIDIEKSNEFESTDFRIDGKYKNKVLWMLINQYRFKVRTPVQEIISNARDAQRENGNPDRPIKIQLPTKLEPTFIVRDYGVGMNEQRVKDIFTSFGASTKNSDNSQTGGFGIGAKSPLAYTDSFNIKTYVDGTYWFYVVAKTDNEGISINLLDKGETTEENGTEVQIPVKTFDSKDFIQAARRCTMFWDVKPIMNIDNESVFSGLGTGTEIADNFRVFTSSELLGVFDEKFIVVVDGIPYECDYKMRQDVKAMNKIVDKLNYDGRAVLFLNTGDIDLLQTREAIDSTERTLNKLCLVNDFCLDELEKYIDSCFTEKTLLGRVKQFNDVKSRFSGISQHKFTPFVITNRYIYLDNSIETLEYSYRSKATNDLVSTIQKDTNDRTFSVNDVRNNSFYWDDLKDSETDTMKTRRMRYRVEQTGKRVILIKQGNSTNFVYTRTLRMLGAQKLSSLSKPPSKAKGKGKGATKRLPENVFMHVLGGSNRQWSSSYKLHSTQYKLSELQQKVVYVEYSNNNSYLEGGATVDFLRNHYDFIVAKMSQKDIKAVKDDPRFIHIDDFMADFKLDGELEKMYLNKFRDDNIGRVGRKIASNEKRIKDKVLVKLAQAVLPQKVDVDNYEFSRSIRQLLEKRYEKKIKAIYVMNKMYNRRLNERYPFAKDIDCKDLINYINRGA